MRRTFTMVLGTALAAGLVGTAVPAGAAEGGRARPRVAPLPAAGSRDARADGKVRLAVTFEPGADADAVLATVRGEGAKVARRIPQLRVVSVEVPALAAPRVAAALARRPGVTDVSPVQARSYAYVPDDTSYAASQPYLAEVNAPAAWDVSKGNADTAIAIVDSGVDVAHPDLAGKVVASHNVVTGTTNVSDAVGHGTFAAGVAAATTDNALGIAGAGFDSRLIAVKVADSGGSVATDDEAAGIVWAADNGADVINVSLGGSTTDATEQAAVAYAIDKGVVVVASAGNDGVSAQSYPAAYSGVVAVGATTGTSRASFSNFGSWVDLGAPGVNIRSTAPTAGSVMFDASYDTADGTSFSAPLVAGAAALLRAANPALDQAAVAAALTDGTTGTYGFAHGRIDFAAALDQIAPVSVPSLTAPADAATVSGHVTVSATSTADRVRFSLSNGPSAFANVVEGVATTTLETFGLSGAQSVTAVDCGPVECATGTDTVAVTVDNGVPTITGPAGGSLVNTASFTATATTPGDVGAVRFLVDGANGPHDATVPFSVSIGTSALSEGAHQLTAVICNAAGTRCDTANPSAAVSFTVQALHPAITSIAPNPFSPNADGLLDAAVVTYTLDTTQTVVLQIKNSSGTVVRGPGTLGTFGAGTRTWGWNGKRSDGTVAPNGTYTVEIATSKTTDNGTLGGAASKTVRLDTVAPGMATVSGSGSTFYPYKDGYKDTFAPAVTLGETGRLFLGVYNSAGTKVRTIDGGTKSAGRHSVVWNGRRADGSALPAGTYKYAFTATDAAKNTRTTGRYTVYVSAKKLTAQVGTRTLSPYNSMTGSFEGDCSALGTPAVSTWTGSIAYYSGYYCYNPADPISDVALTDHRFTLPAAVKYGTVRIGATGERAVSGYPDTGLLIYNDPAGALTDWDATLGASYGTYWGPSVGSASLLSGRTLKWTAATAGGNWYHIRSFQLKWVYYVLA
ncbi:MAG TPA: S8 family serine peptidase [Frankiaceae bacterium]|nr:S8 family serine peptidase [Frankiaceae bacterium]